MEVPPITTPSPDLSKEIAQSLFELRRDKDRFHVHAHVLLIEDGDYHRLLKIVSHYEKTLEYNRLRKASPKEKDDEKSGRGRKRYDPLQFKIVTSIQS